MDIKEKILVCGDVKGQFKYLFNRVETINRKNGPFELLLCVGDFFDKNNDELIAYRNGAKNVPIPTYILGPNVYEHKQFYEDITDNEICTNLTYLGRRGVYTTTSGIKIAYLSGNESIDGNSEINFNKDDVIAIKNFCLIGKKTMSDYRGIDILLTSQWPCGISIDEGMTSKIKSESLLISWLAKEIKPRYHFCGMNNVYYEKVPYRNLSDQNTQLELATRFISLSQVNSNKDPKSKFVYALSITPVDKMRLTDVIQKTTNETLSPYNSLNFDRNLNTNATSAETTKQYFYDMNFNNPDRKRKHNRNEGQHLNKRHQNFDQEKCWFCLSSKDVEKHLIISIGENFYLTLAKGPINEYHILILSVTHIQSTSLLSKTDWAELQKFKNSITEFYKSLNKCVIFFERNYKSSHLQLNAIGIDLESEWKIKHAFEDKSEEYNLEFETLPKLIEPTQLPESGPYFLMELPNNTTVLTKQMKYFPLHFGREVICAENLLNCENKIDWKECCLQQEEEVKIVQNFRQNFKSFDFTL